jgi:uncharacterized membrane protein YoaK (UPF0700 family)
MLVLLAAIAGWIDALSFTALGKVFTSFQSGNLIFLGLGVDEGDAQLFVGAGVSLLAFLAGTALGAYVVRRAEVDASSISSLVPAFVLQLALLVALAVGWQVLGAPTGNSASRIVLVALGAAAMGIQGAAVFTLRIPGVVTNAMTATLMLAGIFLGLRARGEAEAQKASQTPIGILAVLCTLAIAGLLSRDHEFQSIGSIRGRTLQSHPD